MRFNLVLGGVASLALVCAAAPAMAGPGFVALEGSDATALHHDGSYTPQLFKYLQGGSSKNVLVYNPAGVIDLSGIDGGVGTTNVTSLSGVTLSDYSALYIESPGGCCTADNTALNGFGSAVAAFIGAGGNLSIENYVGGAYDGAVPGGAAPTGAIYPSYFCSDAEKVSSAGIAKGFTQPPVDGCWSHQAYENSYWASQGYINLITADPTLIYGDGTNNGSSFLARGGTLGGKVPEPAALALFGLGVLGVGIGRRRAR